MEQKVNQKKGSKALTLTGISVFVVILVSCTLRAPITSVGPVLDQISSALNLDNFESGLLTSIPLIIFATCSVLVSRFSHQLSITKFLMYAMIVLSIGLVVRVSGTESGLFIGSVFIGLGICIGNVVTPGYIKNNFPAKIGLMTGVFAIAMNLTAALASGYSVIIGQWTGLGWKGSLGVWVIVAVLALLIALLELLCGKKEKIQPKESVVIVSKHDRNMFKSKQAWAISIFMGIQSLVFYSLVAWLPAVLGSHGMPEKETGWVLFVIQFSMLPITFIGPIIALKMKNQRLMIPFICATMLLSVLMFTWFKTDYIYLTATLLGISNGMSFSLSILFFSLRTKSSYNAIRVSGMAQSVGYLIAATGPTIFGKLYDWDTSWNSSFYFIAMAIFVMFFFGLRAAQNKCVED